MYKIETGIPIPAVTRQHKNTIVGTLRKLQRDQSFVIRNTKSATAASSVYSFSKTIPTRKFTLRKINKTDVRIWRVY